VESNGRTFNEWLRSQLRVKKMSQRQLAMQAGVDHSTISRLLRGDRTPSLGTATKLARGLREVLDETETTRYFGVVENATVNPVARVEYALRSDDALTEAQVRRLMESYLSMRRRWLPNGAIDAANGGRAAGGRTSGHPLVRANGRPAF
jgi:transcriptional regulator with XRE-family HTH domain